METILGLLLVLLPLVFKLVEKKLKSSGSDGSGRPLGRTASSCGGAKSCFSTAEGAEDACETDGSEDKKACFQAYAC